MRTLHVRPSAVVATIWCGAFLLVLWPYLNALRGPAPLQFTVLLAHVSGMLAGYGVVILVLLVARTPLLERSVGADRLARWHALGGRTVIALVLVHAWAATDAWARSRQESLWLATWHVLRLPGLIAATTATILFLTVAMLSVRAARRSEPPRRVRRRSSLRLQRSLESAGDGSEPVRLRPG